MKYIYPMSISIVQMVVYNNYEMNEILFDFMIIWVCLIDFFVILSPIGASCLRC